MWAENAIDILLTSPSRPRLENLPRSRYGHRVLTSRFTELVLGHGHLPRVARVVLWTQSAQPRSSSDDGNGLDDFMGSNSHTEGKHVAPRKECLLGLRQAL